eukprot:6082701-Pyramimonas_sp.AAC.1
MLKDQGAWRERPTKPCICIDVLEPRALRARKGSSCSSADRIESNKADINHVVNILCFLLPLPHFSSSALIDQSTGDMSPSYGPRTMQRFSAMLHYAMGC